MKNLQQKPLSSQIVHKNQWFGVRRDELEEHQQYFVIEKEGSALTIPMNEQGKVLLLDVFRYPIQQLSLEFPNGAIDPGEDPKSAAKRELLEETGIDSTSLKKIGECFPAPGYSKSKEYIFLAQVKDKQHIFLPQSEDIRGYHWLSIEELLLAVHDHTLTDGYSLTALVFLKQYLQSR